MICDGTVPVLTRHGGLDTNLSNNLGEQHIYMLVPKCALSQFANWDPSLRTEIHLSQFAH